MEKLIIIKLGGSVITNKNDPKPNARLEVIKRLGKELGQLLKENRYKLILVHGAGSFAHPLVKKYQLNLGYRSNQQRKAMSLAHQQLTQLNSLVLTELTKNQIPAVVFPPHAFITQSQGKLINFNYSLIQKALDADFVPVLFGDMVLDAKMGFSVISGDIISIYLAKKLKADQVIFLSDVDGIFDSNPKKNPKAKLIPQITRKNFKELIANLTPNNRDDVTEEMKGKIKAIQTLSKYINVTITNGFTAGSLLKAINGEMTGTKFLLK